jgi:hypothetical protein
MWADLRLIIDFQELDQMTLFDAYCEWIDWQNQKMAEDYTKQIQIYLQKLNIHAIAKTMGGSDGEAPQEPPQPNFWYMDNNKAQQSILNG